MKRAPIPNPVSWSMSEVGRLCGPVCKSTACLEAGFVALIWSEDGLEIRTYEFQQVERKVPKTSLEIVVKVFSRNNQIRKAKIVIYGHGYTGIKDHLQRNTKIVNYLTQCLWYQRTGLTNELLPKSRLTCEAYELYN